MENVPKIVRERLGAAMPVDPHLDADVLTAFAERSLPEVDRDTVLEHLARCSDCREVLALALPQPEATQTVIAPARGGWLTWPALRWGFVAAGGVAIISLGILQYQRHAQSVTMVARQTASAQAGASSVEPQAAGSSAASFEKQENSAADRLSSPSAALSTEKAELNKPNVIASTEPPPTSLQQQRSSGGLIGGVPRGQFVHGPAMPTQWQQQTVRVPAAPAPMPSANATHGSTSLAMSKEVPQSSQVVQVETTNQAPVNAEAQNLAPTQDQGSPLQAQSTQAAQEFEYPSGAIGKAKPAANAQAAEAAPAQTVSGPVVQNLKDRDLNQLKAAAPVPRWTISSTGGLQRSFDQGQTWQDVDVNPNAGFGQSDDYATSVKILPYPPPKEARANKKDLQHPAALYVLRAVAANGPEVWVGYTQGLLLHSVDVGAHWAYVWPVAGGVNLTGDIVALEFADAEHGKVTTSTGEIWITSDDGQTWQKQ